MCRESCEDKDTPCVLKHTTKKQYYTFANNFYTCIYKQPNLTPYEIAIIEIYNECSMARTQNGIDYNVLIEVAKANGLKNFNDLLFLAGRIESDLNASRKVK